VSGEGQTFSKGMRFTGEREMNMRDAALFALRLLAEVDDLMG
jgi:hypothetical protein